MEQVSREANWFSAIQEIPCHIMETIERENIQSSATHIFILPYFPVDNACIIYTSKVQNS
jgi:hypothetical protein